MKTRLSVLARISRLLLLTLTLWWFFADLVRSQDPARELLVHINTARLAGGLHPYVTNGALTIAAQRHSNDMAATGQISHTGSDDSSVTQRILEAGYGVYEFGPVVSENIYGGVGRSQVPFDAWMDESGARSNLLHDTYRELGIGVASDTQGRTFWTLVVGAQPNVLPVLINYGAAHVDTISVELTLLPENTVPEGLGTAIGQPVEYRASTSPQFTDAEWRVWAEQVDFVLDEQPARQTVYVQLRDTAGRTALSQASVIVGELEVTGTPTEPVATETPGTPTTTATVTVTATLTRTPDISPTPTTAAPPTATGTATPPPSPSPSPSPVPSLTPQPTLSETPSATVTDTPSPTNTSTSVPVPSATATRPATLAPSPEPTVLPIATTRVIPTKVDDKDRSQSPPLASRLGRWALGLQAVALVLGVYVALRRPGGEMEDEDF